VDRYDQKHRARRPDGRLDPTGQRYHGCRTPVNPLGSRRGTKLQIFTPISADGAWRRCRFDTFSFDNMVEEAFHAIEEDALDRTRHRPPWPSCSCSRRRRQGGEVRSLPGRNRQGRISASLVILSESCCDLYGDLRDSADLGPRCDPADRLSWRRNRDPRARRPTVLVSEMGYGGLHVKPLSRERTSPHDRNQKRLADAHRGRGCAAR